MGLPVWKAPTPLDTAKARADASASQRSPIRRRRSPPGSRVAPNRRVQVAGGVAANGASRSRRTNDTGFAWSSLDAYRYPSTAELAGILRPAIISISDRQERTREAGRELAEALESRRRIHMDNLMPSDATGTDGQPSSRSSPFDYVDFPPLRRMNGRSINDSPDPLGDASRPANPARVDGLGDRERSFTPEEENWETMLTTIAPDPHPPSADSSFTTAVATASFSSRPDSNPRDDSGSRSQSASRSDSTSHSARSSQTHLTVPFHPSSEDEEALSEDAQRADRRPYHRGRHYHTAESLSDCDYDTDMPEPPTGPNLNALYASTRNPPDSITPPRAPTAPPRPHPLDNVSFDAPETLRRPLRDTSADDDLTERLHLDPSAYYFFTRYSARNPTPGFPRSGSRSPIPLVDSERRSPRPTHRPHPARGVGSARRAERERRRLQMSAAATPDGPTDENRDAAAEEAVMDPDLEEARSMLARLARREDIDEEWWIRAGLRDIVGRIGARGSI